MTTLTIDDSFVGKMHLSLVSVQQTTVWSVVISGEIMCTVEKCHILAVSSNSILISFFQQWQ